MSAGSSSGYAATRQGLIGMLSGLVFNVRINTTNTPPLVLCIQRRQFLAYFLHLR